MSFYSIYVHLSTSTSTSTSREGGIGQREIFKGEVGGGTMMYAIRWKTLWHKARAMNNENNNNNNDNDNDNDESNRKRVICR